MATKTISIMDDAYELLKKNKLPHESFSEVVRRTFTKKYDLSPFIGAWKEMPKKEIGQMKALIEKRRRYSRLSLGK